MEAKWRGVIVVAVKVAALGNSQGISDMIPEGRGIHCRLYSRTWS